MKYSNIVFIGMPSSGKTTIGQIIAKQLKMEFVDTDTLMIEKTGKSLRDAVLDYGLTYSLELQDEIVSNFNGIHHVISTGGGIIYGPKSMDYLRKTGLVIYLSVSFAEIESRLEPGRRFARMNDQTLEDLYIERQPLYKKFADIKVDCTGKNVEEISNEILKLIKTSYNSFISS